MHRERMLLEQLMHLADEQDIAAFPPVGSGIPGKLFIIISHSIEILFSQVHQLVGLDQ